MRRVAVLACLLVGASSCSILAQVDASKIRTVRTCPNVMRYRCFTKYVYATSELKGHCNGPKGIVRFTEIDRGPN
jgi:hypothetical protein